MYAGSHCLVISVFVSVLRRFVAMRHDKRISTTKNKTYARMKGPDGIGTIIAFVLILLAKKLH